MFALSAGAKLTANAAGAALAGLLAGAPSAWHFVLAGAPPVLAGAAEPSPCADPPHSPRQGDVEPAPAARDQVVLQDDVSIASLIAQASLAHLAAVDSSDHLAMGRRVAETAPNGSWDVVPGTAHYPNMERPAQFTALLQAFLSA